MTIGPTRPLPRVQPPPSSLMPTGPRHCKKGPSTFLYQGFFSIAALQDCAVNQGSDCSDCGWQDRPGACCETQKKTRSCSDHVAGPSRLYAFLLSRHLTPACRMCGAAASCIVVVVPPPLSALLSC